jgi:hypothetical protein
MNRKNNPRLSGVVFLPKEQSLKDILKVILFYQYVL